MLHPKNMACGNLFVEPLEPEEMQMRAAHEGWRNSVEPLRRVIGGKYSAT